MIEFPTNSRYEIQSRPGGYHVGVLVHGDGRRLETRHHRTRGEAWEDIIACVEGRAVWRTQLDAMEAVLHSVIGQPYLGHHWPSPYRDDWDQFEECMRGSSPNPRTLRPLLSRLLDDLPIATLRTVEGLRRSGPLLSTLEGNSQLRASTLLPPVEMFVRGITDAPLIFARKALALGVISATSEGSLEFRPPPLPEPTSTRDDAWSAGPVLHPQHAAWREALLDEWEAGPERRRDCRYFAFGLGSPPPVVAALLDRLRDQLVHGRQVMDTGDMARIVGGALGRDVSLAAVQCTA